MLAGVVGISLYRAGPVLKNETSIVAFTDALPTPPASVEKCE